MSLEHGRRPLARWVTLPALTAAAALIGCGRSQPQPAPKGPQPRRTGAQQTPAGRQNRTRGMGRHGDSGMMGGRGMMGGPGGMMGHGGGPGMMGGQGGMMGRSGTSGAQGAKAEAPAAPTVHQAGWKVYVRENCAACHAISGKGGTVGPNLTHVGSRLKAAAIERQVKSGGGGMPASKLSQKDLAALTDYLTSLK
jgi:mono/diheme cytochrome c family protein